MGAARSAGVPMLEVRYEELARDPEAVAELIGAHLDTPAVPLAAALERAHAGSVGRYERDLDESQLADVLVEAGDLLRELGFVSSASA